MSRIDKMSIQGIRSFSPASHEKIEIFTPVTLILGPNGTGKTTIIECLKYATTGELPPGTKGSGCFVHDPKLAQEVEVKAKVGLTVKDVSGNNMVITRSLQAIQKCKAIQMRTLDGVIKRQSSAGEWKSISSKCAELDREMVTSLGVSKAVLESVIFCHQEDANWPLAEGKAVKQRFDDIFASTRYVKALEAIRKSKMELDQNTKGHKINVAHLKEQTAKATEVRADFDDTQQKLEVKEEALVKVAGELEPLKGELGKFRQQYQELCDVQSDIRTHEHEKKVLTEAVSRLRANISTDFEGSDVELERTIASAAETLGKTEEQKSVLEREVAETRRELERLGTTQNRLLVEKGKQEQERDAVEQDRKKLLKLVEEYSRREGIAAAFDSEATLDDHSEFLGALKGQQAASEAELVSKSAKFEDREREVQRDLDRLRGAISKLEKSKELKLQQLESSRRQLRQTRAKLADAESSVERLEAARAKLAQAEAKVTSAEEAGSLRLLRREIEAEKAALAAQNAEMARLDEQLAEALRRADQLAERAQVEREAKEKESAARRLRSKLADSLEQVFCGEPPKERLRAALESKLQDLQETNRRQAEKLQASRASLTKRETELKFLKEQLEAKRQRQRAIEEQLASVCGSAGFDEALRSCTEKKRSAEEDYAFIQGSVATYRKFKERLDKDRACPLCHRGFDSAMDAEELSEELAQKLSVAPKELRNKERERKSVSAKYDALQQLTALPKELEALQRTEVPELERKLADKTRQAGELSREVEDGASVLELQTGDEAEAKSIQGEVVLLERFEAEQRAANDRLRALDAASDGAAGGPSLEELQQRKAALRAEIECAAESLEDKRMAAEEQAEEAERLRASAGRLREECLALEKKNADKVHLQGDASKLEREASRLEEEVSQEEGSFPPLRKEILALEQELKEVRQRKEEAMEAERRRGAELGRCIADLERPLNAVRKYAEQGKETKLRQLVRRIEEAEAAFKEKKKSITDREADLAKVRSAISDHRVRHRELLDCLDAREKEAAVVALEEVLSGLRAQVGGVRVSELQRNLKDLMKQEEVLLQRKQRLMTEKTHLEGQLKQLKKELESALYKDAMKKYTGALHELKTTQVAAGDLEKYYRALDRAIMTYHAYKMEEINKIVKELWRNTYRGNDIDYIEIRSDEDEAGVTRSRRTYNYRVVMVKSDTALDMRGRCSAGQKVLASLIIRMALSEAFCLNCGVLALDEPTTNLDRENIESLAFALVEIIKARSKQKNFQLIVITHDEDFVELLGRSEFVEHFFRISRTSEGLSKIKKVKIDEEFR